MLRIGGWLVDPAAGQISRDGDTARLEARTMQLLLYLAGHAGEVVSIDELLDQVWAGVIVTPDSVYHAVATLRRLLGDDPKQPTYIATVPRLGYRMVASVIALPERSLSDGSSKEQLVVRAVTVQQSRSEQPAVVQSARAGFRLAIASSLCLALAFAVALAFHIHRNSATSNRPASIAVSSVPVSTVSPRSIAVLPFLDLTEGMREEEFADGMTEELIDRISKLPGFRVPAPTSSFYFKNKRVPVPDIARTLGVAYVLDGSIRKSGRRLRVAARLICADRGYVVWSETYDRPWDDILNIQDEIACNVMRALKAAIAAEADHPKSG